MRSVSVFAPASVGNLSCGFDVFGLAVCSPGDEVTIELIDSHEVRIDAIKGDRGRLPLDAGKNTAGIAVIEYLKSIQSSRGVAIVLNKNLPLGSGMGSSAASAVAAVVGVNHLMGNLKRREELLPFVMEAERIACGSAHADNGAPSLLGGLILVRQNHPLDIVSIPTPKNLMCALVHPQIEVETKDARSVLKKMIELKDGVTQWANAAALVAGMMKGDYELIGRSIADVIAEPVRADLIPGFHRVKSAALRNGALGCGISGSGPTIFCLCKGTEDAHRAGDAIQKEFESMGLKSEVFVSPVNQEGAYIIECK
ncbi:MAG TPA: homoserine kinase [Cyclobacteriaceae bacterium]|nr:homoserine kinase [Cyclobacteriaceae bacterium]